MLAAALPDSFVDAELAAALEALGWKPSTPTEHVYAAIAHRNCGHSDLDQAARDWADREGYWIMIGPGACNATWGGW